MSTVAEQKPSSEGDESVADDSKKSTDAKSVQEWWEEQGQMARRTWGFVAVAVVCLLATGLIEVTSRPAAIEEYGKVGQAFYPDFTDPTVATALSVKVVDSQDLVPLEFSVRQAANGRWVIPSHHNYPADAADQLAETASSVIGIKRGAMVTRWPSDHTRYGVVDPETDSVGVDEIEGIGKRLTLRGKDDSVLASFIIGKKVEDEEGQYYVRHPAEDETYITDLDISLSTKFTDWVNTDLLDITNTDVRRVDLNDYSFEERGRGLAVTQTVSSTLSRESSSDDWQMEGIDTESQEVDKEAIDATVNAAADLKLVGVRPKQEGLTSDLQLDSTKIRSQNDVERIQADLLARGFLLQRTPENPDVLQLISREGEMSIGTEDGLRYQLHFGRVFTGSDKELEIGLLDGEEEDSDSDESKDDPDQADDDEASDADEEEGEEEETSSGKPGRYVFVRVEFDAELLGEQPNPVEPEMPEELKKAEEKEKEDAGAEPDAEKEAEGESDEEAAAKAEEERAEAEKLQKLRDDYDAAKQKYQDDLSALETYKENVNSGKEKAEELNRRFAQWYYVIPGDSYDKLSLSREDLIKDKEADAPAADSPAAGLPGAGPSLQLDPPPVNLTSPGNESPAEMKDEGEPKPSEGEDKTDPKPDAEKADSPKEDDAKEEATPEKDPPNKDEPEPKTDEPEPKTDEPEPKTNEPEPKPDKQDEPAKEDAANESPEPSEPAEAEGEP